MMQPSLLLKGLEPLYIQVSQQKPVVPLESQRISFGFVWNRVPHWIYCLAIILPIFQQLQGGLSLSPVVTCHRWPWSKTLARFGAKGSVAHHHPGSRSRHRQASQIRVPNMSRLELALWTNGKVHSQKLTSHLILGLTLQWPLAHSEMAPKHLRDVMGVPTQRDLHELIEATPP